MRKPETKALLKPILMQAVLEQLVERKDSHQQASFSLEPHRFYFFKDPDFKGTGIMAITIESPNSEILDKVQNKLEPQFAKLFRDLDSLSNSNMGNVAKINYIQPNPNWDVRVVNGTMSRTFYVGLSKTAGETQWLTQKLAEISRMFINRVNDNEREDIEIQQVLLDIKVNIFGGKQLLKQLKEYEKS